MRALPIVWKRRGAQGCGSQRAGGVCGEAEAEGQGDPAPEEEVLARIRC